MFTNEFEFAMIPKNKKNKFLGGLVWLNYNYVVSELHSDFSSHNYS